VHREMGHGAGQTCARVMWGSMHRRRRGASCSLLSQLYLCIVLQFE
jgi:hypothetical protein